MQGPVWHRRGCRSPGIYIDWCVDILKGNRSRDIDRRPGEFGGSHISSFEKLLSAWKRTAVSERLNVLAARFVSALRHALFTPVPRLVKYLDTSHLGQCGIESIYCKIAVRSNVYFDDPTVPINQYSCSFSSLAGCTNQRPIHKLGAASKKKRKLPRLRIMGKGSWFWMGE